MRNSILKMAIEQQEDLAVKAEKEQEITFYAHIQKPEGLEQAYGSEEHVQAEIKIDKDRRIRVRKTTSKDKEPEYTITTKVIRSDVEGVRTFDETTEVITKEVFEIFKNTVPSYQNKTRYFFKIESIKVTDAEGEKEIDLGDLKYEVDVFTNSDGKRSDWCKIDVEIQGVEQKLKEAGINVEKFNINVKASELPFAPTDFIIMDKETSEEDQAKVSELYDKEFLIYNHLPGQEPQAVVAEQAAQNEGADEAAQSSASDEAPEESQQLPEDQ